MTGRPGNTGFTLVEVMVALVVGGMAVAGAAVLLSGLNGRAAAIERAAERVDRAANGERLLRELMANLAVSQDSTPSFVGDSSDARFLSWCDTTPPNRWLERCRVHLFLERHGAFATLHLEVNGRPATAIQLVEGLEAGRFRYLINIDRALRWRDHWSHLVPPTALAVVSARDTLLVPVWGSE